VFPIWSCLTWKKASGWAAVTSCFVGQAAALISWFVAASIQSGSISVSTLGTNEVMLTVSLNIFRYIIIIPTISSNIFLIDVQGNLFALFGSGILMIILCLIWPDNYDFETCKTNITLVENDQTGLDPADYDEVKLGQARAWIENYGYGFTFLSKYNHFITDHQPHV